MSIFQHKQDWFLFGQPSELMHDRGNRCGLALGRCQIKRRITIVERDRKKVGEKTPRRVTEIVCCTEQRFQLLQLDRGRILQRKAGGTLKLTDDGMKGAVRVIGRTLEDQMVVGIVNDSLKQGVNDP